MEDNKGVSEINEGKDEVTVMILPTTDVETESISETTKKLGSSPISNIKSTKSRKLQQIPTPELPATNDTSSSYVKPTSSSVLSDGETEYEDEEEYETIKKVKLPRMKVKKKVAWSFIGCIFVCLLGILIASLTVHKLKSALIWSLELWKWIVFVLVIFCGRLISKWLIRILVFFIKRTGLRKEFVYFANEMQKSVRPFVWLGLILLAWVLLIDHSLKRSKDATKILDHVTNALGGCLIGAAIWLVKDFLIEFVASSFQSGRFFDRIRVSAFHRYVVKTLSGPPSNERRADKLMRRILSFRPANNGTTGKQEEGKIDAETLHRYRIKQDKMSAWTMNALISEMIRHGLLISRSKCDMYEDEDDEINLIVTTEMEAMAAAYWIFKNVARPGSKYIEEDDLLRFMIKEQVDLFFPLLEGAETGRVDISSLTKWVVGAYQENTALTQSLSYTRKALEKLNRLTSGIVIIIGIIITCSMMGFLTTKVFVFISSQILLVSFMFSNTAKTVFEAIVFVFIVHPFDVGDRCTIDGEQLVVENINILHTIFFRRNDMQKLLYPNSVLLTKTIGRGTDQEMGDCVEFNIDLSTPAEKIALLKTRIKEYLEKNDEFWDPSYSVVVKDIDTTGNLKTALYVTHTKNCQDREELSRRRSELILELKNIFEQLDINFRT